MDKWVLLAYIILVFGLFVNGVIFATLPPCKQTCVTYKTGEKLCGNITAMRKLLNPDYMEVWTTNYSIISYLEGDRSPKLIPMNATYPLPTTSSTTTSSTTSTTCPIKTCPTIPDCVCTCPVCTKCRECEEWLLTEKQNKWLLNMHPEGGMTGYQAGYMDCKDEVLAYLEVPGRPKFKSRPRMDYSILDRAGVERPQEKYCFINQGGYFILNRTANADYNRSTWGWNDDACRSSWLRVNNLWNE